MLIWIIVVLLVVWLLGYVGPNGFVCVNFDSHNLNFATFKEIR